jgi:hypothetical protein
LRQKSPEKNYSPQSQNSTERKKSTERHESHASGIIKISSEEKLSNLDWSFKGSINPKNSYPAREKEKDKEKFKQLIDYYLKHPLSHEQCLIDNEYIRKHFGQNWNHSFLIKDSDLLKLMNDVCGFYEQRFNHLIDHLNLKTTVQRGKKSKKTFIFFIH